MGLLVGQDLIFLVSKFTAPQISEMLGVSLRTVCRRMSQYSLSVSASYADLTDDELDELVKAIQDQFPMCGNRQMIGHLLSRGSTN